MHILQYANIYLSSRLYIFEDYHVRHTMSVQIMTLMSVTTCHRLLAHL